MSRVAGKLLVVAFVFGLTGCGGGDNPDRPALYPVKGKVTLNGEILAGAWIKTGRNGEIDRVKDQGCERWIERPC